MTDTAPPTPFAQQRSFVARHARAHPLLALFLLALLALVLWQTWTAPPWRLNAAPRLAGVDLLDASGKVFAHRGPRPSERIDAARLPDDVRDAFLAIEDRRFYSHGALDYRGLARAVLTNLRAGGVSQGGSTITQQYVKNAFLTHDRTWTRKFKELLLADWAENWMSKDEILSRYLEHAYFGAQQTGLAAASRYYFDRSPEKLSLGQAAMLAGLVKAPSRLAPTVDRTAARARMRVVLGAMVDAGFITERDARRVRNPRVVSSGRTRESAGWFADWLYTRLPDDSTGRIATTLEPEIQRRAERVVDQARLDGAEIALIALRPDGRVAALVGGKDWQPGAFNRVSQAKRQPGSTFKLFDYFAAFRAGARPDDVVFDAPIAVGEWRPTNGYRGYRGPMTLREAFAISSNTAAVRIARAAGYREVVRAAHDLGIASALPEGAPSLPLGTATLTLEELAGAYAAFALGRYPVVPHGLAEGTKPPAKRLDERREWAPMLDLLWEAANAGTGRRAASLRLPTFGKTGTSQDGRDTLFVGFSGDLVTAIWIGRDDNKPIPGASGGHLPAQVWRSFMSGLRLKPIDIPAPPRAARERRLWGAEDTPGFEDEAAQAPGDESPAITLPVDPSQLPPGPPFQQDNGPPAVILPGAPAPQPEGDQPEDEDGPGVPEDPV
ncbi:penicillin-binding protein 1A [Novosphingobium chloroacetimidivorans]|uniref:Penicillin-binding protein 1A n=1 Tax=Novosphingobium chloroacetimidivorans TaxID=1428314 RepID=A0A7W7NW42_9SPHN|nr:transglycosylase domain-containing protein [Novosphingobium chloroacetimidivorans]MBB4859148.1 penicillin-binding protein 1A [Novosphingobium chloroacetimidivorans]